MFRETPDVNENKSCPWHSAALPTHPILTFHLTFQHHTRHWLTTRSMWSREWQWSNLCFHGPSPHSPHPPIPSHPVQSQKYKLIYRSLLLKFKKHKNNIIKNIFYNICHSLMTVHSLYHQLWFYILYTVQPHNVHILYNINSEAYFIQRYPWSLVLP